MITHSKKLQKLYDEIDNIDPYELEDLVYDYAFTSCDHDFDFTVLFNQIYELGKKNKPVYYIEAYVGRTYFTENENKIIKIFEQELHRLKEDNEKEEVEQNKREKAQLLEELKNAEERVKDLKKKVGKDKTTNV